MRADRYFELIIREIFDTLQSFYAGADTGKNLLSMQDAFESLPRRFYNWLCVYWTFERDEKNRNLPVYDLTRREDYLRAVLHYISGMTDKYAIDTYHDIISF